MKTLARIPQCAARTLVIGVLAVGCKQDETAASAPASDDPAPAKADADAKDTAVKKPKTTGEGGLAGMAKGLLDEVKATPTDPLAIVPASAVLVMEIKPQAFRLMPGWEEMRELINKEMQGDSTIASLSGCGLDVELVTGFTLAMTEGKHALGIVNGPGYGILKNHECATKAVAKPDKYALAEHEGQTRIVFDDAFAYVLADDALLIVDKEIDAEVAALRAGKGTPLREGELAGTLGKVDRDKHAWFVLRVADFAASEFGLTAFMSDPKRMWGTAHFDSDLQIAFVAQLGDATAATNLRDQAQRQFDEIKAMLPMIGIPASLTSRVTIGATDDRFSVDVAASTAELEGLRDAVKRNF